MELHDMILDAVIRIFNKKGLKFTMDDISRQLHISKKTIYTVFPDKNSLISEMVDFCFDSIKESETAILEDKSLNTIEKLRQILGVLPESYHDIDFQQLYILKDRYPKIYNKVEKRLETGWENTISLIEKGIAEGCIRDISIPLFKTVFEATLEQFFRRDILVINNISYQDALKEIVDILISGIRKQEVV